jgi:hypothetical protein
MILTVSKEFTINMGNYESVKIGGSVQADSEEEGYEGLKKTLREMLKPDLVRAGQISDVKNTYILTWLEEDNA